VLALAWLLPITVNLLIALAMRGRDATLPTAGVVRRGAI